MSGITDCIKTNFSNFFPEEIVEDGRFVSRIAYIGRYFGFYHDNLPDKNVIDSFNRKIERFNNILNSDKKVVFIRTCSLPDYNNELESLKEFEALIKIKYVSLKFIIIFILCDQDTTTYYKNSGNSIFIFTMYEQMNKQKEFGNFYKPIFDYILDNDLFEKIPEANESLVIKKLTSKYLFVDRVPVVHDYDSFT